MLSRLCSCCQQLVAAGRLAFQPFKLWARRRSSIPFSSFAVSRLDVGLAELTDGGTTAGGDSSTNCQKGNQGTLTSPGYPAVLDDSRLINVMLVGLIFIKMNPSDPEGKLITDAEVYINSVKKWSWGKGSTSRFILPSRPEPRYPATISTAHGYTLKQSPIVLISTLKSPQTSTALAQSSPAGRSLVNLAKAPAQASPSWTFPDSVVKSTFTQLTARASDLQLSCSANTPNLTGGAGVNSDIYFHNDDFEIRSSSKGGLGGFARRDFPDAGDLVWSEHPLLETTEDQFMKAFEELSAENQWKFRGLTRYDALSPDPLLATYRTNRFGIPARNPSSRRHSVSNYPTSAVFHLASRFNHACRPNMTYVWETEYGGEMTFRTLREVKAGEELTVAYGGTPEQLEEGYGFICTCGDCEPLEKMPKPLRSRGGNAGNGRRGPNRGQVYGGKRVWQYFNGLWRRRWMNRDGTIWW